MFQCFNVIQTRDRLMKSSVLFKKVFNRADVADINVPTTKDFTEALQLMTKNSTLNENDPRILKIKKLIQNLKVIGKHTTGSIYERDACRDEIIALVTLYGLPNLFITINPSDITNPTISFWYGDEEFKFNLDTLDPSYPSKSKRAEMVAKDPVHAAQFFHVYMKAFMETFMGFSDGRLLNETVFTGSGSRGLQACFGTVECQGRGSLHCHMLAWFAGFPSPKGNIE
jgi:hypothetical protein